MSPQQTLSDNGSKFNFIEQLACLNEEDSDDSPDKKEGDVDDEDREDNDMILMMNSNF